jgi:hypothetical protein
MQMKREPGAGATPAEHSFRSIGLCASCPPCASGLLAAKVSRGAGLRASDGVRMVRRGFRALKTPERASYSPTLQRRPVECTGAALGRHSDSTWRAKREQKKLHSDCIQTPLRFRTKSGGTSEPLSEDTKREVKDHIGRL